MTQRPRRPNDKPFSAHAGPGQDIIIVKQQAAQFPGVGVTLPGYRSSSGQPTKSAQPIAPPASRWRRFKKRITLKRSILAIVLILAVLGAWFGSKLLIDLHKLFGGNLFSIFTTTKLKGEDSGRVNILLAGNSADDQGHSGGDLTDSIMVVSIDTKNNTAFLLSLPRDLWVKTDTNGYQKINDAYVDGQTNGFSQAGYPSGGMGELEKIVSQKLAIPIDYYALINYAAIRDAVNAVGGIDLTIQSQDPRGLYDPSIDYATHGPLVRLTNGLHTLNGVQALDLARARGDAYGSYGFAGSDFDRTQHQRQMLVALKNKADSLGVLANPATVTNLADAFGNNVKTDFQLSEIHRLYDITKQISGSHIQSLSLSNVNGKSLLTSYVSNGQDTLIPVAGVNDYSAIQAYIRQQTSNNPVVKENAAIVLLNGTNTHGLATSVKNSLSTQNYTIGKVGNAYTVAQVTTSIIDNSVGKKPATRAALGQAFGNNFTTVNPYTGVYNADFIIVLGTDQVKSTP